MTVLVSWLVGLVIGSLAGGSLIGVLWCHHRLKQVALVVRFQQDCIDDLTFNLSTLTTAVFGEDEEEPEAVELEAAADFVASGVLPLRLRDALKQ